MNNLLNENQNDDNVSRQNKIKILFLGDIFGKTGRKIVYQNLTKIINDHQIDWIVANGENATHGKSLSPKHYQRLKKIGINVFTMGNHVYERSDTVNFLQDTNDIIRPANFLFYGKEIGMGSNVFDVKGCKIRITNLLGTKLMKLPKNLIIENPFFHLDEIVKHDQSDFHFVDFHAESTAEKIALAWDFDGKISGLYGTHTHVPTADFRTLPKGTFFISDLGMVGGYHSIIGAKPEKIIYGLRHDTRITVENAGFPGQMCGMILSLDCLQKKIVKMEQFYKIFNQ